MLQAIAREVDPKELQIVSFHPGAILSEASRTAGLDETSLPWDDGEKPSSSRLETNSPALLSNLGTKKVWQWADHPV